MTSACENLHHYVRELPRHHAGFDPKNLPSNGIYFLFETNEVAHEGERIVRIGTHRGPNNLIKRLNEHLYTPNKDRSIFRKHIGRAILKRDLHPFANHWEIDLTKKADKEKFGHLIDLAQQSKVEEIVTNYMVTNFSFCTLKTDTNADREDLEERFISTLIKCPHCFASSAWLGKHHPNSKISEGKLWNIQGTKGAAFSCEEIDTLFNK